MTIVHVTGVSTWGLYTKCTICMLRLVHDDYRTWGLYTKCTICRLRLVHDDYWPNAQFACFRCEYMMVIPFAQLHVQDCYNNIPNCDFEHWIPYYSTHHSWLCFSDFDRFCWVNCCLCFFAWVHFKVHLIWRICSSLTVRSRLRYESLTWIQNFDWDSNLQLGPTYL